MCMTETVLCIFGAIAPIHRDKHDFDDVSHRKFILNLKNVSGTDCTKQHSKDKSQIS